MTERRALIKALFARLVEAAGKSEAAGAYLDLSGQRIRQLCDPGNAECPSLDKHILPLEEWLGRPIVTEELAHRTASVSHAETLERAFDMIRRVSGGRGA